MISKARLQRACATRSRPLLMILALVTIPIMAGLISGVGHSGRYGTCWQAYL
jgi:hypothetical protein